MYKYELYPEEKKVVKDLIIQIEANIRECDPIEPDNPDEEKFYNATVGLTAEETLVLRSLLTRMNLHIHQSPGPKIPISHNRK